MWKSFEEETPKTTIDCFDPDTCEKFKRSIPCIGIDRYNESATFCYCKFDSGDIAIVEAMFCIGRIKNGKELITLWNCEDFHPTVWIEFPNIL